MREKNSAMESDGKAASAAAAARLADVEEKLATAVARADATERDYDAAKIAIEEKEAIVARLEADLSGVAKRAAEMENAAAELEAARARFGDVRIRGGFGGFRRRRTSRGERSARARSRRGARGDGVARTASVGG